MMWVMMQIMLSHAAAADGAGGHAHVCCDDGDGGDAHDGAHGDDGDGDDTHDHAADDAAAANYHSCAVLHTMRITDMISRRGHPSLKKFDAP